MRVDGVRLVVFDMDGVLIDHVSSWSAVHEALGTTNEEAVRAFLDGRIDDREFIARDVALWRSARPDFGLEELRKILRRVPRMPGLREATDSLVRRGATCAIVSGGLKELATMLAGEASFPHVRANGVVFGPDGRLAPAGTVEVPLRDKARVVAEIQDRLGVPPASTAAIGDSHFDLGMFARAAISVAFNPKDDEVARSARHVVRRKDLRQAVAPILEAADGSR